MIWEENGRGESERTAPGVVVKISRSLGARSNTRAFRRSYWKSNMHSQLRRVLQSAATIATRLASQLHARGDLEYGHVNKHKLASVGCLVLLTCVPSLVSQTKTDLDNDIHDRLHRAPLLDAYESPCDVDT